MYMYNNLKVISKCKWLDTVWSVSMLDSKLVLYYYKIIDIHNKQPVSVVVVQLLDCVGVLGSTPLKPFYNFFMCFNIIFIHTWFDNHAWGMGKVRSSLQLCYKVGVVSYTLGYFCTANFLKALFLALNCSGVGIYRLKMNCRL